MVQNIIVHPVINYTTCTQNNLPASFPYDNLDTSFAPAAITIGSHRFYVIVKICIIRDTHTHTHTLKLIQIMVFCIRIFAKLLTKYLNNYVRFHCYENNPVIKVAQCAK